jgi:hypothetical protein
MAIAEFGHLVIIIAALLYMASYVGLGVRLEQMISVGRAPKTLPGFFGLLSAFKAVGFIFGRKHRDVGDAALTALVYLCRVLFMLVVLVGLCMLGLRHA